MMIHPDGKLKPFAKDWEFDMVKETELKMQSIRRIFAVQAGFCFPAGLGIFLASRHSN